MFVFKPKVKSNKLKQNKNFLDFSINKGENTICRRFSYIDDSITNFDDAYDIIDKHFNVDDKGKYNHDVTVKFTITNDVTGIEITKEYTKHFNSKVKLLNVKNGIKEMMQLLKNDSEGEN